MKLSIIVPVYNMAADKKLEYCMDSLVNQTITDYEIIAVDDASTDNSVEILRAYEEKYPEKMKVLCHSVNKRQGGAKNTGLSAASGEWIGFIDSDDWVTPDYYEKLLKKAQETGADMVGCDYNLVQEHTMETGKVVQNNSLNQTGVLDKEKHRKLLLRSGSMVIKIYRHSVIKENNLRFPEGIFYEDNCAGPLWSLYFTHFEKVEEPNYYYYQHQVSTVHHITEEKCRDRMRAAALFYEECRERGFLEQYHDEIEYRFTELYYAITLFSYLSGVKSPKLSFVKELRRGVTERFPDFEQNSYYQEMTGKEERELIALQGKSDAGFFWYYRLKQAVRNMGKAFFVLLLGELLLLLLGIAGLFGKNAVYQYDEADAVIEQNAAAGENQVEFRQISLPAGTYQIRLKYHTDTDGSNYCGIYDNSMPPQKLRTNGVLLYSGRQETDYELWLLQDTSQMTVYTQYGGEGVLEVTGLEIVETKAWNRILLFLMLCIFLLVDACVIYARHNKREAMSLKQKNVVFFLGLTMVFASLPLLIDAMISAGDLGYHLMRVEGIKDGLLSGQFPIRISPKWQQGYGYASPIFYGETLLYLAGLFRLIGFSILSSYRLYMLAVTAATVLIAYFCFKKIFQNAYAGVFCSMLYTLSVYRIYKTYLCGSWGETMGIMILPFLVYGFYRVFTQDIHEKSYKRSWIPLTIGFTLLVQSHLLTGEMAGFFTIILCIVMIKRVFRKETFIVLAKTVIYSVLLSAWFLVPFADYMLTGNFVIQNVSARTIQDRGLYPAHLFFGFFRAGDVVFFEEQGMANTQPMGVGIALTAALLIWCFLRFNGKKEGLMASEVALGRIAGWFGTAAMLMSLSIFPWDKIHGLGDVAATLVSSIQFPNRFLTISNVCLVTVAGVIAKYVLVNGKKLWQFAYVGGMLILVGISSLFLMNDMLDKAETFKAYNSEGIGTGYIAGAEYLPYGADASAFMWHDPITSEGVTAQNYVRKELGGETDITNTGQSAGTAAFSLLYYKGYHAYNMSTGEEMNCYAGNNFEVTVEIPAGFEGRIKVVFESPWYWQAGEAVSLVTLAVMVISAFCRRKWDTKPLTRQNERKNDRQIQKVSCEKL